MAYTATVDRYNSMSPLTRTKCGMVNGDIVDRHEEQRR